MITKEERFHFTKDFRTALSGTTPWLRRNCFWFCASLALLFTGALFWAHSVDPLSRIDFDMEDGDVKTTGFVLIPKPVRPRPVVVFVHGLEESALKEAQNLRQLTDSGLAVVAFKIESDNVRFVRQMRAIGAFLEHQDWFQSTEVVWLGSAEGASKLVQLAANRGEFEPSLLVGIGPTFQSQPSETLSNLPCPVVFFNGRDDAIAMQQIRSRTVNPATAKVYLLGGARHDFGENRSGVFRIAGEYCAGFFATTQSSGRHLSSEQWRNQTISIFWFCAPALLCLTLYTYFNRQTLIQLPKRLKRAFIVCLFLVLGMKTTTWALKRSFVGSRSDQICEAVFVSKNRQRAYHQLRATASSAKLSWSILTEHLDLSAYNREIVNWKVEDEIYFKYVLSPVLEVGNLDFSWRRPLWESLYPRIRKENQTTSAAEIVVRYLRERVTITTNVCSSDVSIIWGNQLADEKGFQTLCVAAFRSVGVPARLDSKRAAEFWDGEDWKSAPQPIAQAWQTLDSASFTNENGNVKKSDSN